MIDRTGLSPDYLIQDELSGIYDSNRVDNNLVFLKKAPFYANGLLVSLVDVAGEVRPLIKYIVDVLEYELQLGDKSSNNLFWTHCGCWLKDYREPYLSYINHWRYASWLIVGAFSRTRTVTY